VIADTCSSINVVSFSLAELRFFVRFESLLSTRRCATCQVFLRIKLTNAVAPERGIDFFERLAHRDELGLIIGLMSSDPYKKSGSISQRLLIDNGTVPSLEQSIFEFLAHEIRHLFGALPEKRRSKLHRPRWPRGRSHKPATLSLHGSGSTSFLGGRVRFIVLICRFVFCGDDAEVLRRFWVGGISLLEKAIDELLGGSLYPLTGHRLCGAALTLALTPTVYTTGNITKVVFDRRKQY
jgi:hypothetical protein